MDSFNTGRRRQASHSARRRKVGVTLVDGLIAIFVMALLLLGLTSLLIASRVNARLATENNAAYLAARQVIENVRIHRGAPLTHRDYNKADVLKLGAVPQIGGLTNSNVSMTLSPWMDPSTGDLRESLTSVRVTVTWNASSGTQAAKTRTFVSLITPDGVVK